MGVASASHRPTACTMFRMDQRTLPGASLGVFWILFALVGCGWRLWPLTSHGERGATGPFSGREVLNSNALPRSQALCTELLYRHGAFRQGPSVRVATIGDLAGRPFLVVLMLDG